MESPVSGNFEKSGAALADKAGRVQSMGKQGLEAIAGMASQARDVVSDTSESVVAYTKKNPVKALAIAAASGALLYAVINAVAPSRKRS
jgi:ElaB/YqjD/DUF883 family membrane-anchored ribosome-binding protein